ncbi:hypothetical protein PR048_010360 [Dryococelus australis]|uniref:Uncharacterized protein n=1 Tax=Dryococelus australis TaxID=614101 RepID=A0ABQ9I2J2_9NEOP|nr:hypothetical protein PR048_010360 [Dryococelus australis]
MVEKNASCDLYVVRPRHRKLQEMRTCFAFSKYRAQFELETIALELKTVMWDGCLSNESKLLHNTTTSCICDICTELECAQLTAPCITRKDRRLVLESPSNRDKNDFFSPLYLTMRWSETCESTIAGCAVLHFRFCSNRITRLPLEVHSYNKSIGKSARKFRALSLRVMGHQMHVSASPLPLAYSRASNPLNSHRHMEQQSIREENKYFIEVVYVKWRNSRLSTPSPLTKSTGVLPYQDVHHRWEMSPPTCRDNANWTDVTPVSRRTNDLGKHWTNFLFIITLGATRAAACVGSLEWPVVPRECGYEDEERRCNDHFELCEGLNVSEQRGQKKAHSPSRGDVGFHARRLQLVTRSCARGEADSADGPLCIPRPPAIVLTSGETSGPASDFSRPSPVKGRALQKYLASTHFVTNSFTSCGVAIMFLFFLRRALHLRRACFSQEHARGYRQFAANPEVGGAQDKEVEQSFASRYPAAHAQWRVVNCCKGKLVLAHCCLTSEQQGTTIRVLWRQLQSCILLVDCILDVHGKPIASSMVQHRASASLPYNSSPHAIAKVSEIVPLAIKTTPFANQRQVSHLSASRSQSENGSDEALGVRVKVARIAPSLLDFGRSAPSVFMKRTEHTVRSQLTSADKPPVISAAVSGQQRKSGLHKLISRADDGVGMCLRQHGLAELQKCEEGGGGVPTSSWSVEVARGERGTAARFNMRRPTTIANPRDPPSLSDAMRRAGASVEVSSCRYLMAILHGTRFRKSLCRVCHSCRYTGLYGTRHGIFRLALPDFITETEVSMKQRQNERAGETGDNRENPPTNGIVLHDSHMQKSGLGSVSMSLPTLRHIFQLPSSGTCGILTMATTMRVDKSGLTSIDNEVAETQKPRSCRVWYDGFPSTLSPEVCCDWLMASPFTLGGVL